MLDSKAAPAGRAYTRRRILFVTSVAVAAVGATALAGPPGNPARSPISLPAPKSFPAAVAAVERATGAKGGPIETAGDPVPAEEGRSFAVDSKVAERLLAGSHATFRKAGFYLFRHERSFGMEGEKDRIALMATTDRNEVIRRMGTSGAHHTLTTDQIIAWLDALAKDEPFVLTEIGVDYLAGRFDRKPKDPAALARRSAEFAPDLVAGRASTLALLAEEIRANRTLYLIW
jgi:hypothetical protein